MAVIWLMLAIGLAPLVAAFALLPPARPSRLSGAALASSALFCTLAFNLTFFWQELWLVLAKAMTPGLHPTLYHNNHDWTGSSPVAELLQGAGALATLISGLAFLLILIRLRTSGGSWRLFVAWMAFEGLFQSFSQVAVGALIPANDVGRAFAYLGFDGIAKALALGCAVIGMAAAGGALARYWPPADDRRDATSDRGLITALAIPAAISVLLSVPFRLPRNLIEVLLVPAVVVIIGVGWTALGGVFDRKPVPSVPVERPALLAPAAALLALLAFFQLVLARGVAF